MILGEFSKMRKVHREIPQSGMVAWVLPSGGQGNGCICWESLGCK